jgi:hypothetical protein
LPPVGWIRTWSPPPSDNFLGLAAGLVFLTVTSLSGMLVSLSLSGLDTNEYTNNFAGCQQTGAYNHEGWMRENTSICGYF